MVALRRWAGAVAGHSHLWTLAWARGWRLRRGVVWGLARALSRFWAKMGMFEGWTPDGALAGRLVAVAAGALISLITQADA